MVRHIEITSHPFPEYTILRFQAQLSRDDSDCFIDVVSIMEYLFTIPKNILNIHSISAKLGCEEVATLEFDDIELVQQLIDNGEATYFSMTTTYKGYTAIIILESDLNAAFVMMDSNSQQILIEDFAYIFDKALSNSQQNGKENGEK